MVVIHKVLVLHMKVFMIDIQVGDKLNGTYSMVVMLLLPLNG